MDLRSIVAWALVAISCATMHVAMAAGSLYHVGIGELKAVIELVIIQYCSGVLSYAAGAVQGRLTSLDPQLM